VADTAAFEKLLPPVFGKERRLPDVIKPVLQTRVLAFFIVYSSVPRGRGQLNCIENLRATGSKGTLRAYEPWTKGCSLKRLVPPVMERRTTRRIEAGSVLSRDRLFLFSGPAARPVMEGVV
jgi:hypothetical protein